MRKRGADFEDDVLQVEVDAGCDEGWGDDQTADLDVEAVSVPGVVVEHDSSDVACFC